MRDASRIATTGGRDANMRRWIALLIGVVVSAWVGCDSEPNKTHYITAEVRRVCPASDDPKRCRLDVMKRMVDVPLEELRAKYPEPERPSRPSCSLR